jgi:S-adenosylmethionine decarboxylase
MPTDGIITQGLLIDVTVFPHPFNELIRIQDLIADIADVIDVKIEKLTSHKFKGQGITVAAIVSESHIVVHTWPEHAYIQIDISSCKDFEFEDVIQMIRDDYKLVKGHYAMVYRGLVPPMPDQVFQIEDFEDER